MAEDEPVLWFVLRLPALSSCLCAAAGRPAWKPEPPPTPGPLGELREGCTACLPGDEPVEGNPDGCWLSRRRSEPHWLGNCCLCCSFAR